MADGCRSTLWSRVALLSAQMPRGAQNEPQNLGNRAIQLLWDFFLELERGQGFGKRGILFQRHTTLARHVDDLLTELAAPRCDHARRTARIVFQRDGER